MKKYLARLLRRSAQKLDPQVERSLPVYTTAGTSSVTLTWIKPWEATR